jgi:putative protease
MNPNRPSQTGTADFIPEILAPAGGPEQFLAALYSGADAVYLGLERFNARARATNFDLDSLAEYLPLAKKYGMKVLVALNILIKDLELPDILATLTRLADMDIHALIVQDIGLAAICRTHFPELRVHASTQLAIHNADGVAKAAALGFRRIVLARELTAIEIKRIRSQFDRSHVELEAFCHGSLCYSYSGLCFFSGAEDARSGNRGECAYTCRKPYRIVSEPGEGFLFSMKDLNTIDQLESLVATGIDALKIEGRKKDSQYVMTSVQAYRNGLDAAFGYPTLRSNAPAFARELYRPGQSKDRLKELNDELSLSFRRGETSLFLRGRYHENVIDLNNPTHQGLAAGTIKRVIPGPKGTLAIEFQCETDLEVYDGIRLDSSSAGSNKLRNRYNNEVPEFSLRQLSVPGTPVAAKAAGVPGKNAYNAVRGDTVTVTLDAEFVSRFGEHVVPGTRITKTRSSALRAKTTALAKLHDNDKIRCSTDVELEFSLAAATPNLDIHVTVLLANQNLPRSERTILCTSFTLPLLQQRNTDSNETGSWDRLEAEFESVFHVFGDGRWNATSITIAPRAAAPRTSEGAAESQHPPFVTRSQLKQLKRQLSTAVESGYTMRQAQRLQQVSAIVVGEGKPHTVTTQGSINLAVKIDRLEYFEPICQVLPLLAAAGVTLDEIVFEPKRSNLPGLKPAEFAHELVAARQRMTDQHNAVPALRLAVPTVLRAWDEPLFKQFLHACSAAGVTRFEVGNLGALALLDRCNLLSKSETTDVADVSSDFTLFALNRAASREIGRLGISRMALSIEDDRTDLATHLLAWQHDNAPSAAPQVIVYKDTPLFIAESCSLTALHNGCPTNAVCGYRTLEVEDDAGERYFVAHESCKSIVYGKRAFAIPQHIDGLIGLGVKHFRADFLTRPYEPAKIVEILLAVAKRSQLAETTTCNFERQLL